MRPEEANRRRHWCVFDGMKKIPSTPDSLMAEINVAISNLEYTRATSFLDSQSPSPSASSSDRDRIHHEYDAREADEAYKAGCAALAAGKLEEAIQSMNLSLAKCPPDRTSAVSKLQSLISLTSQQLHRSSSSKR